MNNRDLETVLDYYESIGLLTEDAEAIDMHLHAAIEAGALEMGLQGHLGLDDWVKVTVQDIKTALRIEMCDASKGSVKSKYANLLDKSTSKEAMSAVYAIVSIVMPPLYMTSVAVSTVAVYVSIWMVKIGMNSLCSAPASNELRKNHSWFT